MTASESEPIRCPRDSAPASAFAEAGGVVEVRLLLVSGPAKG